MRYSENLVSEPLYSQSDGLHYMLLFTVVLAFCIGCILLWLGRRGRVMWLTVWSAGLILASAGYVFAYLAGWVRNVS
jgi:hypothetical protein